MYTIVNKVETTRVNSTISFGGLGSLFLGGQSEYQLPTAVHEMILTAKQKSKKNQFSGSPIVLATLRYYCYDNSNFNTSI